MAGGDGSQAVVAMVAAEQDLPYACIPAGTRNHFALDLGVDRDDVVGALDAFVDGRERRVDLAEVNGRVFVNNVSIGLYAEAVQREGYREAKLRTILDTLPEVLGPEGKGLDLRWSGPGGLSTPPVRRSSSPTIATASGVRSARAPGRGSTTGCWGSPSHPRRPQAGALQRPWREWSAPAFEVDADGPVSAGIDGEAVALDAPLRFRILPAALRVRIAAAHPGASPSAAMPEGAWETVRALARMAAGDAETHGIVVPISELLNEAKAIDTAVYRAIAAGETPSLDVAMRGLSRAADHSKLWFAVAAGLAFLGGPSGRLAARKGLVSLGLASGFANLVAKPLTARRRPTRSEAEELASRHVQMPRSSSFPSGHAASAFAFATGAANAQPMLSAPLRALATLVGYSRVHTGVHYPADVLAGAFIGVSAAELAGHLLDR